MKLQITRHLSTLAVVGLLLTLFVAINPARAFADNNNYPGQPIPPAQGTVTVESSDNSLVVNKDGTISEDFIFTILKLGANTTGSIEFRAADSIAAQAFAIAGITNTNITTDANAKVGITLTGLPGADVAFTIYNSAGDVVDSGTLTLSNLPALTAGGTGETGVNAVVIAFVVLSLFGAALFARRLKLSK
jgi:hypothetical protein